MDGSWAAWPQALAIETDAKRRSRQTSMPAVDSRPVTRGLAVATMRDMELLLIFTLIVAFGLLSQVAGADSRDNDSRTTRPSW
jgi:hypothetical protein